VGVEDNCLYSYEVQQADSISVVEKSISSTFLQRDSNVSTTCFKRSGRRGEFVLTNYNLSWDKVHSLVGIFLPPAKHRRDGRLVGWQCRNASS
jgi:hypothetical protein